MVVLKVALVVFLVVAVTFFVVVYIRKAWRAGGLPLARSTSHFHQAYLGAQPPTPKPDWAIERAEDEHRR
ncbi:MAG: hypothetical protein SW019_07020 [Actinomycetota bacterium]|nr:hypothetical protein [Actinomycetota bacterium]